MKALSIVGILLGMAGIFAGLYNISEFVEGAKDTSQDNWLYYDDNKMMWGYIALGTGALGLILGAVAGSKKAKLGWVAVILSLVAVYFGLSQATHMFS